MVKIKNGKCPRCGLKLVPDEVAAGTGSGPMEDRLSLGTIVSLLMLWVLVCGLITMLFFLMDGNDSSEMLEPIPGW